MEIYNKAQMYSLLRIGALGNYLRVWDTAEALLASGYDGKIGVRCANKSGGPFYPGREIQEAISIAARLTEEGWIAKLCEASPDRFLTIQGEIQETPFGLAGELSRVKTFMRAALQQERLMTLGIGTWDLLTRVGGLSEVDIEDFHMLLDTYPEHVIEFSAFEVFIGAFAGRKHCIWEIRKREVCNVNLL